MNMQFTKVNKLKGILNLPGDKSISHRSVIFAAMANGKSLIKNISDGEDVKSTINCFKLLGCNIYNSNSDLVIEGLGYKGFSNKDVTLDAGNSGTTSRLLTGLLCVQNFCTTIIGDESLSKRPMNRVVDPLISFGAKIETNNGKLPLKIYPSNDIKNFEYNLTVPSAQVKSALILAALHFEKQSIINEPFTTRNHTEQMLGLKVVQNDNLKTIYVSKSNYPVASEYVVPSDISTAAFFIVFGLLAKDSEIIIKNVLLNKTRAGIITILKQMGGKIDIINEYNSNNEIYGDILIKSSKLHNIEIEEDIIPNIIDEIPILSLAGLFADGDFVIKNASELRVKETDRIKALVENYKKLGVITEEFDDGFGLYGNFNDVYMEFESFGDHRIAMTFGILSMLLKNGGKVNNFDCVNISNPNFINQVKILIGE